MSDEPPIALVRTHARRHRLSWIWAIPVVTLITAGWLVWDTLSKRGSEITIRFDAASGLQPDQSHIRHRDVNLGVVKKITLSPDRRYVLVTARMTREAEPLLTDKSQLWVVKPRFFAGSLTGLETLVSGTYIQLEPTGDGGTPRYDFIGLEDPPVVHAAVPGHTFRLKTPRLRALNPGSAILFRDLTVGEVLGWEIGSTGMDITVHAFVRAPYDQYVREGTIFWNASGASIQIGGAGVKLELDSLRALALGGIAFETPARRGETPQANENQEFRLYADHDAAETSTFGPPVRFLTYFKGSTAGLSAGAPVVFLGLRIGAVSKVALHYDPATDSVTVAAEYEIEPERIEQLKVSGGADMDARMRDLIGRGMRVRLDTASLVTGGKQLALDIVPKAAPIAFEKAGDVYIMPPLGDDQGDIMASAGALIAHINAIPFEDIAANLNKVLSGASATVNDPKLRDAVAALNETLAVTKALMVTLNNGADPMLRRLPSIAREIDEAVAHANHLVASFDQSHGDGSQIGRDTARLMAQLTDAARSIRIVADLLARHPEALVRGRAEQEVR